MKTIILILFSLNLCIGQSDTIVTLGYIDTAPDPNLKDTVKLIMLVSDTTKMVHESIKANLEYGYIIKSDPFETYVSDGIYCRRRIGYNKQEFHSLDFKPLNPNLIVWDYKEIK